MFERNLLEAGYAGAVESGALRPLEWSVLVARLAAARDLRSIFARGKSASGGNFARFSTDPSANLNTLASCVNRDDLADGKDNGAIMPAAAGPAETGDREL
jgi:hypothetical protein